MTKQTFYVAPFYGNPDNSASVFERGRVNEFGEPYCVQPALTYAEAHDLARRLNRATSELSPADLSRMADNMLKE